jgi:tRNA(adenine34) deaminase
MTVIWSTLSSPWQVSLEQAWKAYGSGSLPIGAAIVDTDGQILSRGRNRIFETSAEGGYLYGQTLAHAEVNALLSLPEQDGDIRKSLALYTTTEPCPLCLGAFYMSGLRKLHYASREPYAGSVNRLGTTPYLSRKLIRVIGPDRADLEIIMVALKTDFHLRKWGDKAKGVIESWELVIPDGVRLGKALFRSKELQKLVEKGLNIEQVLNFLGEII